jgi:hypothetical protein
VVVLGMLQKNNRLSLKKKTLLTSMILKKNIGLNAVLPSYFE